MRIFLSSADPTLLAELQPRLHADLVKADLAKLIAVTPIESEATMKALSGRATVAAILLTAVGAGGAGTVLMGELGKFAPVLEAYVQQDNLQIHVEKPDGTQVEITGNARYIEKLLNRALQDNASQADRGGDSQ